MKLNKNMIFSMLGCIMLATLTVLSIAVFSDRSHAWFSFNTSVQAEGVEVAVGSGADYMLGTKGIYDDLLSNYTFEDESKDFAQGAVFCDALSNNYYVTGSDVTIRLRTDESLTGSKLLAPASAGEITFYVISKVQANGQTVKIDLSLSGYTAEDSVLTRSEHEDTQELLKGHILFFGTENGSAYSDLLENGEMTVEITGEVTPVTVYWVWEGFFSNYTNGENRNAQDHNKIVKSIIKDIDNAQADENYHSAYFSQVAVTEIYADNNVYEEIEQGWHGDNISWIRKSYLNDKYNEADQMIGIDFDFILLEITLNQ